MFFLCRLVLLPPYFPDSHTTRKHSWFFPHRSSPMAAPPSNSDPGLVEQHSLPMVTSLCPGKSTTKLQGIYLATAQPFLSAQGLEDPSSYDKGGRKRKNPYPQLTKSRTDSRVLLYPASNSPTASRAEPAVRGEMARGWEPLRRLQMWAGGGRSAQDLDLGGEGSMCLKH